MKQVFSDSTSMHMKFIECRYEVLAEKQQSAFHDGITVLVSCTVKLVLEQLAVFLT